MEELLLEVLKHYGLKEVSGPQVNTHIIEFFKEIGFDWVNSDETAWCSASLNYFCKKLGYERSGKLDARSWLKVGTEVKTPSIGNVVVFWRNKPDSWEGHVALYINEDKDNIFVLGGNQGDSISIAPYQKNRVLGYRSLKKL
jgi:uncharacterized protein (TIGR02594 family)